VSCGDVEYGLLADEKIEGDFNNLKSRLTINIGPVLSLCRKLQYFLELI
jgi:hypothetical protein